MTKFLYLKAVLRAASPLKLSSGDGDFTDSDVLVDSAGAPFIPGTSLAGAIRHYLDAVNAGRCTSYSVRKDSGVEPRKGMRPYSDAWFGFIEGPDKIEKECLDSADDEAERLGHQIEGPDEVEKEEGITEKWCDSKVVVHDAFLDADATFSISSRDGVALNDFKAAKPVSKHDYQVVDAGAAFVFRMRIDATEALAGVSEDEKDTAEGLARSIVAGLASGELRLGGKTRRGFGELAVECAQTRCIDLSEKDGREQFIDFSWDDERWDDESSFTSMKIQGGEGVQESSLYGKTWEPIFEVRSFLTIRDYGSTIPSGHEGKFVDSEPLRSEPLRDAQGEEGNPIIPGASWAGLFRHHMYRILRRTGEKEDDAKDIIDQLFGTIEGNRATASLIEFSESTVEGSNPLNVTRNAIDRFTGGAAPRKLFTNNIACGGTVTLRVRLRKLDSLPKERQDQVKDICELFCPLIEATLKDIGEGYAAIGGMTSVGGGMLREQSGTSEWGDGNAR